MGNMDRQENEWGWPSAEDIRRVTEAVEGTPGDWLSGMDHFVLSVAGGVHNAEVYTELAVTGVQFQAVFVAMAKVNGRVYMSSYITGKLSIGMNAEQVKRDSAPIIKSLVHSLGEAVFGADSDGLSPALFDVLSIEKHGGM